MIIALTMNPSLDISYPLNELIIDSVNRVNDTQKTAGGKGINVARVATLGGTEVIATGLLGGNIGRYIQDKLEKDRISHHFLSIAQESRNCIAILHEGLQTEILEGGPTISSMEQQQFKNHFSELIQKGDVVTISGSLPMGIGKDYYAELIDIANQQSKKVLLDCSGQELLLALQQDQLPYLIKPNYEELGLLVGKTFSEADINGLANTLKHHPLLQKVPVIVISLGKYGALAKCHNQLFRVTIPKIDVVNPVGSGDSTLAGLAIGINNNESLSDTLKRAMTFGMLNAMEKKTGFIDMQKYDSLFNRVIVEEI